MNALYTNIYNSLIYLSRNKDLYNSLDRKDNFYDRLFFFLIHFSFFLKNYNNPKKKKLFQNIYDYNFKQIELSIRETGYGDQLVNKKMKIYINLFHEILSKIHFWDNFSNDEKIVLFNNYLTDYKKIDVIIDYFDQFNDNLSKNTLNYFLKSVINN